MQLHPGEKFIIYRQLADHTDSTTYYVQAVIRNAKTATLLATVNLTDNNNGDFTGEWQVPEDPSGEGFYVKIITSVYTDSNYTTKSPNHADEGETYLIQTRVNALGGGGGYIEVDYKKIQKIIQTEVARQTVFVETKEVNLSKVIQAIESLQNQISSIKIPNPKPIDLNPVTQGLISLKNAINDIEIPQPEKINLKPVLKAIDKAKLDKAQENIDTLFANIKQFFQSDVAKFINEVEQIKKKLNNIPVLMLGTQQEDQKPKRKFFQSFR